MLLILFKYCIKVIGVVFYDILFYHHVKKDKVVLSLPIKSKIIHLKNDLAEHIFHTSMKEKKNIY